MIDGPTILMRFLIYIPTIQSMTCIMSIELVIMSSNTSDLRKNGMIDMNTMTTHLANIYKAFAFSLLSEFFIAYIEKASPKKALNEVIQAVR